MADPPRNKDLADDCCDKEPPTGEIMMNIDQIASEALQLDPEERALLAETIWASLEDPFVLAAEMSDEQAVKLAIQRNDEIESGTETPITHKELMDRLRKSEG